MQSDELVIPLPVNRDVEIQSLKDDVFMWKLRFGLVHKALRERTKNRKWETKIDSGIYHLHGIAGFWLGAAVFQTIPNKTMREYILIVLGCLGLFCCYRMCRLIWKSPLRKSYASMVKSVDTEDLKSSA